MIPAIIGGVAFVALPLVFGWILVTGLRRGVIAARGGSYSRATEPIMFWAVTAVCAGVILFWVAMVSLAVVTTLRVR